MWDSSAHRSTDQFFADVVASGSHLKSLEMVRDGEVDAAAIDSNVLRLVGGKNLRVIETWGPFAIQPAIVRAALDAREKERIARALLTLHTRHDLSRFGYERFVEPDETLYA